MKVNCVQMMLVNCERAAGRRKVLRGSLDRAVGESISVVILRVRGQGEGSWGTESCLCKGRGGVGAGLRSFRRTGATLGGQQAWAGLGRSVGPWDAIPESPYSAALGFPSGESLLGSPWWVCRGAPDLSCGGCSGGEGGE